MVYLHFSIWKQKLTIFRQSRSKEYIFARFNLFLFLFNFLYDLGLLFGLFLFLDFLLLRILVPALRTSIITLPIRIALAVLLLNLNVLLLDAEDPLIGLLFLELLLEQLGKIIVLLILLIALIDLHKAVRLIPHVVPQGLAIREIPRPFVLAQQTQKAHVHLLVQVRKQALNVLAVLCLRDEEPV